MVRSPPAGVNIIFTCHRGSSWLPGASSGTRGVTDGGSRLSLSVATDEASVAQAFFLPRTCVLHRRCKAPASAMSPALRCSNAATAGPSVGIPRRLLIVHSGHGRWKHATVGVPHRARDAVPDVCRRVRRPRAASSSAPRAYEASEVACALRSYLARSEARRNARQAAGAVWPGRTPRAWATALQCEILPWA
jgi:hypothetical protein